MNGNDIGYPCKDCITYAICHSNNKSEKTYDILKKLITKCPQYYKYACKVISPEFVYDVKNNYL